MRYDVTIGIPMFQSSDYIRRTMESALAQTYQSIEYLIVDDGCTDNSIAIIYEFQQNHPRGNDIHVITHRCNLGVATARNDIIDNALGDYLYYLDSDDIINQEVISLLMKQIRDHKADIAFGSYEKIGIDGSRSTYQYPNICFDRNDEFAKFAYRKYFGIQASACNYLIKTSILREHNLRFCDSKFWEDTIFTLELVTYIQRAVMLSNITYTYLCRKKSLSDIQLDDNIRKEEIIKYFETVEQLKFRKEELQRKAFFPNRCYVAVMSDIYIICNILKRWEHIKPSFSFKELKAYLSHPASFSEICMFRQGRVKNTVLFFIGKLPAWFCIKCIWCIGKLKKLI